MSKTKYLSAICFGAIALMSSIPANASALLFNFSGPSGTALFQLDSNPTPDFVNLFLPGTDQFGFNNVAGTYNGAAGTASIINFGEGIFASLNIVAPGLGFTQFSGPTLFTGSASAPVFHTGSYTLINPFFGNGTLNVSAVASAVPEPATWGMLIFGFAFAGAAMRYRRRSVATAIA